MVTRHSKTHSAFGVADEGAHELRRIAADFAAGGAAGRGRLAAKTPEEGEKRVGLRHVRRSTSLEGSRCDALRLVLTAAFNAVHMLEKSRSGQPPNLPLF